MNARKIADGTMIALTTVIVIIVAGAVAALLQGLQNYLTTFIPS